MTLDPNDPKWMQQRYHKMRRRDAARRRRDKALDRVFGDFYGKPLGRSLIIFFGAVVFAGGLFGDGGMYAIIGG